MLMNLTAQKAGAREALSKFLKAWKLRNYKDMAKLTTHTWRRTKEGDGSNELEGLFPFKMPNYRITHVSMNNPNIASFKVRVLQQGKEYTLFFVTVCEIAPHLPSPAGDWGVNPSSIKRL